MSTSDSRMATCAGAGSQRAKHSNTWHGMEPRGCRLHDGALHSQQAAVWRTATACGRRPALAPSPAHLHRAQAAQLHAHKDVALLVPAVRQQAVVAQRAPRKQRPGEQEDHDHGHRHDCGAGRARRV